MNEPVQLQRGPTIAVTVVAAAALLATIALDSPVRYVTDAAAQGAPAVTVVATGTVQPTNIVEVSSELDGTIRKVLVDHNSEVEIGQALAELDTDTFAARGKSSQARLASAKAMVREAQASVVEKKLEYKRTQTLVTKKVSSGQQLELANAVYERAVAVLDSARADAAAAEADVVLNETDLKKAIIRSPIAGVVLSRNVEPGQVSIEAPILFAIGGDLAKVKVELDVSEADIGKVREGQRASFAVVAYPGKTFSAQIRQLRFAGSFVQGVVTYKAILTADNPELLLRPGMTVTAKIHAQEVAEAPAEMSSSSRRLSHRE